MATRRTRVGERRWPTAAAVLLTGALRITLPPQLRLNDAGPVLFVILVGLFIVLVLTDRGPASRRTPWRRALTVLPIALITIAILLLFVLSIAAIVRLQRGRRARPALAAESDAVPATGDPDPTDVVIASDPSTPKPPA